MVFCIFAKKNGRCAACVVVFGYFHYNATILLGEVSENVVHCIADYCRCNRHCHQYTSGSD